MLTQKEVKRLFNYDPITGILIWKVSLSNRVSVGDVIKGKDSDGYVVVRINKRTYQAQRIIWLWYYGYMPEGLIDHKDRIKHHNWIDNLREASKSCNARNIGNHKNNTSGVKGVSYNKKDKRWVAYIDVNGKHYYVGFCKDFDEAVCHRLAAEQCFGWEKCDPCSPAYEYIKERRKGWCNSIDG